MELALSPSSTSFSSSSFFVAALEALNRTIELYPALKSVVDFSRVGLLRASSSNNTATDTGSSSEDAIVSSSVADAAVSSFDSGGFGIIPPFAALQRQNNPAIAVGDALYGHRKQLVATATSLGSARLAEALDGDSYMIGVDEYSHLPREQQPVAVEAVVAVFDALYESTGKHIATRLFHKFKHMAHARKVTAP